MKLSMKTIASIMNDNTNEDVKVYVGGCWEDYGAKMWWDTIKVEGTKKNNSYQALSPKEHEDIENGNFTMEQVEELIETANRLCSLKKG